MWWHFFIFTSKFKLQTFPKIHSCTECFWIDLIQSSISFHSNHFLYKPLKQNKLNCLISFHNSKFLAKFTWANWMKKQPSRKISKQVYKSTDLLTQKAEMKQWKKKSHEKKYEIWHFLLIACMHSQVNWWNLPINVIMGCEQPAKSCKSCKSCKGLAHFWLLFSYLTILPPLTHVVYWPMLPPNTG